MCVLTGPTCRMVAPRRTRSFDSWKSAVPARPPVPTRIATINRRAWVVVPFLIMGCAAIVVFFGSGSLWFTYSVARLWLAANGRLPWRLARFLREAREAGVLRQAGPAYQFRHDLISAHLAGPPDQDG
jgi:hypothetical protein